ncbi:aldehyde dehydrogenase family protein, partial [Gordonia rubripertincta]
GVDPKIAQLVIGDRASGEALVDDSRVALVSATGSTRMGKAVAPRVAQRFGRVLLELGGNNAAIVCPSADLDLTVRGLVFSAAGTAGQRCTSLRRVIVHESVADTLVDRLGTAYSSLPVGSPLDSSTLVGPLIDEAAHDGYADALELARKDGGTVVAGGERVRVAGAEDGVYVQPAIVRMPAQTDVVRRETFAPILYVMTYSDLDEAIARANASSYGLGASVFTKDTAVGRRAAEKLDCGVVTVNSVLGFAGVPALPFGGTGDSGFGRIHGDDGLREFSTVKSLTVQGFAAPIDLLTMKRKARNMKLSVLALKLRHGRG